mgnify:CR=1 FL=1
MIDRAFEIVAWVLSIAGLAVIGWALFWDRSRGRRRCPKCWYDMGGAKADGDGRFTCSECGRVVRRERGLLRTRRRWRRGVAGVCVLGLAYAAVAYPRVRDRGWVGVVPTTALVLAHPWLADFAPRDAYMYPAPEDAPVVWLLGEELGSRVRGQDLWNWHAGWLIRNIVRTGGPHLHEYYRVTNWHDGVERTIDEGPVRLRNMPTPPQGQQLHTWLWQMLSGNERTTPHQIGRVLAFSSVRAEYPSVWWQDRSLPLRLHIGVPPVREMAARVFVRDARGELLWTGSFSQVYGHGFGGSPHGPSANGWEAGHIMLPPSDSPHEIEVTITLTEGSCAAHAVTHRIVIDPSFDAQPTTRVQMVRDETIARELSVMMGPTVSIDPEGAWASVFFGYEAMRRPESALFHDARPAVGLRIELLRDTKVVADGAMLIPTISTSFTSQLTLVRSQPLRLLDDVNVDHLATSALTLRVRGCAEVAIRDKHAERGWAGSIEWPMHPTPRHLHPLTRHPQIIFMTENGLREAQSRTEGPN